MITFDRAQFEQDADISLTWRDVHNFIITNYYSHFTTGDVIVDQFEKYLRENEM